LARQAIFFAVMLVQHIQLHSFKKQLAIDLFWILIIDDHFDTTLTFKAALESCNNYTKEFEVHTCNDPLAALLEFKPNFYDLLLIDINSPYMNGFALSERMLM
jgi:CheY-like chemotaxis protein